MSSLKDTLLGSFNSCKLFYDNYVITSKIGNLSKDFNKIRLYFITLLNNVKSFFNNIFKS